MPLAIIDMFGALSLINLLLSMVNRSVLNVSRSLFADAPCQIFPSFGVSPFADLMIITLTDTSLYRSLSSSIPLICTLFNVILSPIRVPKLFSVSVTP